MDGIGAFACFGEALFDFVDCATASDPSMADSIFGIQRENGVRSVTLTMYQSFLEPSQWAPSALTASFSANGVVRFILIGGIIHAGYRTPMGPFCISDQVQSVY